MLNAANDPRQAAAELHCNAYNAAFYELGLRWYWDLATYRSLFPHAEDKDRIRAYLQAEHPHLLSAYDADFLIAAIQTAKARCYDAMVACGPHAAPRTDWAALQSAQVGV